MVSRLFAMVGFNVRDQRILGHVLFFMGKVEQQIKTSKLRIPVDKGSALLAKQARNFSNGRHELILQPVFLGTKTDFRYA